MCKPNIPSVTLATAVLMQVQEFVGSAQSFSRYDITKAIRQKCNDGLLEIPECEDTTGCSSYRYDICKQSVDDIFDQLWNNCLSNGLPPLKVEFDRQRGYRLFSVDQNALATNPIPVPVVQATPTVANVPPITIVPPPNPIVQTTNGNGQTVGLSDAEIRRRIDLYMKSCTQRGATPTIKKIQSAIKRGDKSTGLSYTEIANVAMSLGYKV